MDGQYAEKQATRSPFTNGGFVGQGASQLSQPSTGLAPLDELSKSIAGIYDRTIAAIDTVRGTADALLGSEPPSERGPQGASNGRVGRVWGLNDQAAMVHQAFVELERQINRLAPVSK